MKDVLLVGFGAVGAVYALALKRSGEARVTVVARSNYEAVKSGGMNFHSSTYGKIQGWRPDRLCQSVLEAADRPYSHVFLASKAVPEIRTTPEVLAPLLHVAYSDKYPLPTYVLLQNGVGIEKDLYEAIAKLGKGEPKVVGAALKINTNLSAPNEVIHTSFPPVVLGIYRLDNATSENTVEESSVLEEVGNMLSAGGAKVKIVPQIQWAKFAKNFWNVAFASVTTLTGYPLTAFYRPPPSQETGPYRPYVHPVTADKISAYTLPNVKALLQEMFALGRAMGLPDSEEGITSDQVETGLESIIKARSQPDSVHKTSMLLDKEIGSPMEVEPIFGEVVRLAERYNVNVPRTQMVYALLLVIQNQILCEREANQPWEKKI